MAPRLREPGRHLPSLARRSRRSSRFRPGRAHDRCLTGDSGALTRQLEKILREGPTIAWFDDPWFTDAVGNILGDVDRENARVPVDLEAELDHLFGAELEGFVAERTKLVRALKEDGRRAEAARVQELRKPSLPAWAVNRLVRRNREEVDRLVKAGADLEDAQAALLRGGDRDVFARAHEAERAARRELRAAAEAILGDRASESTLERVDTTLRAAAATADGRAHLSAGRLANELEPRGFEPFAGPGTPIGAARPPRRKLTAKAAGEDRNESRRAGIARARAGLDVAKERERELARRLREADRAVRDARRALDSAEREADRARAGHAAAVEAVEQLRRELDAAKKA